MFEAELAIEWDLEERSIAKARTLMTRLSLVLTYWLDMEILLYASSDGR